MAASPPPCAGRGPPRRRRAPRWSPSTACRRSTTPCGRRARLSSRPILRRDSAYLNWLCADYPDGGYRLHLLDWQGGVAGHLILRLDRDRRGLCRGRIVDLLWPRAEAGLAAWMVAAAVGELRRAGADYVEVVLSRPELAAAARACGFVRRRPVPLWYHRLPAGMDGADDWYITFLDCDRAYR